MTSYDVCMHLLSCSHGIACTINLAMDGWHTRWGASASQLCDSVQFSPPPWYTLGLSSGVLPNHALPACKRNSEFVPISINSEQKGKRKHIVTMSHTNHALTCLFFRWSTCVRETHECQVSCRTGAWWEDQIISSIQQGKSKSGLRTLQAGDRIDSARSLLSLSIFFYSSDPAAMSAAKSICQFTRTHRHHSCSSAHGSNIQHEHLILAQFGHLALLLISLEHQ